MVSPAAYTTCQSFAWTLAERTLTVVSKPGLPYWDALSAAESLAAEFVDLPEGAKAVIYNGRHGALAAALAAASPKASLTCLEPSWLGVQCTRRTLQANAASSAVVLDEPVLPAGLVGALDCAVILIPKGRALARRWLKECRAGLKPGGSLYLCGAKDAGIASVVKDAEELFGESSVLGYKKGERVVKLTAPLTPAPLQPGEEGSEYTLNAPGFEPRLAGLRLFSLPGVFSAGELDEGSALLLAQIPGLLAGMPAGAQVVDAGCGCGVLGLAAARLDHSIQVILLDADLLAVASARHNIALNHIPNAQVYASDLLEGLNNQPDPPAPFPAMSTSPGKGEPVLPLPFREGVAMYASPGSGQISLILSNPPFHAGKETNYAITQALIAQSHAALRPGGKLALVANVFLRYDKHLAERFSRVRVLSQTSKFMVLFAEK